MKISYKLIDGIKGVYSFVLCNSKQQYRKFNVRDDKVYTLDESECDEVLFNSLTNYQAKVLYTDALYNKLKANGVDVSKTEICRSCGGKRYIRIKPLEVWYEDN